MSGEVGQLFKSKKAPNKMVIYRPNVHHVLLSFLSVVDTLLHFSGMVLRRFSVSPTGDLVAATPPSEESDDESWVPSLAQRPVSFSLSSEQSVEPDVDTHEYESTMCVGAFGITLSTSCDQDVQQIRCALDGLWDVVWILERGVSFGKTVERSRVSLTHQQYGGSVLTEMTSIVLQTNTFDGDYVAITSSRLNNVALPKQGTVAPKFGFLEIKDSAQENTVGIVFLSTNRMYDVKVGEVGGRVVRIDVCGLLSGQL